MVELVLTLAVAPLSAQTVLDREIPDNACAITEFFGYSKGGTGTVSNVIVKKGVAFDLIPVITNEDCSLRIRDYQQEYTEKSVSVKFILLETNPKMDKNRLFYSVNAGVNIELLNPTTEFCSDEYGTAYHVMIDDNSLAFCKGDDVYVPAKFTIQCLNQNVNTSVSYDAKTNTITF